MESFVLMVLTFAWATEPPRVESFLFNTPEACLGAQEALRATEQPIAVFCLADPVGAYVETPEEVPAPAPEAAPSSAPKGDPA